MKIDKSLILSGDFSMRSGYYGLLRLINQENRVQAVVMANDMMAIGGYKAMEQSKLEIPKDIAIVGFDDIFSSGIVKPRLTTVHIPVVDLGRRAVEYLIKMIDGHIDPKQPYLEQLSTGLVIGGSCGCKNTTQ
jgi:DNA-binding LacI/PurR family transcriptional regulator